MARPRIPYGRQQPGTMAGVRLRVLAAEMADTARLGRGRELFGASAVIEIDVDAGLVSAQVQGSRPHPYVVTLRATSGAGVPSRDQFRIRCSCPDDQGPIGACKHAVAALFALADEVTVEPDLVERWRCGDEPMPQTTATAASEAARDLDDDNVMDRLVAGGLLRAPRPIPSNTALTPLVRPRHGDPMIDAALDEALGAQSRRR